MFCSDCWAEHKKIKDNCPCCRGADKAGHTVPLLVRNMLAQVLVQCVMCDVTMTREKAQDHPEKECPVKCEDCKEVLNGKNKLEEHKNKMCSNRKATCNKSIIVYNKNFRLGPSTHAVFSVPVYRGTCPWKGSHEDLNSHRCTIDYLNKSHVDAFNAIGTGYLYNPLDKSLIGQGNWVSSTWIGFTGPNITSGTVTLKYFNPFTRVEETKTFNSIDDRVGRYYNVAALKDLVRSDVDYAVYCEGSLSHKRKATALSDD